MLWFHRHGRAETVFALTEMRAMAITTVGFAVMLQQRHAVQATLAHDAFETVAVIHFRERANDLLSCIHTIVAPRTSRCSTKQGWHTRRRLGQHCHRPAHTPLAPRRCGSRPPPFGLPRAWHVANATACVAHVLAPDTHHDPSAGITRAWCKGDGASVGARYSTA